MESTQCYQSVTIQCKNYESVQYLEIVLHSVMLSTVNPTKYCARPILCCLWNLYPDTSDCMTFHIKSATRNMVSDSQTDMCSVLWDICLYALIKEPEGTGLRRIGEDRPIGKKHCRGER